MAAPQSLLQAAAIRLVARLGSGLADSAATLAVLAQDAPARLQQELSLFWEEVEQEAERLERPDQDSPQPSAAPAPAGDPQDQIDALRAQVAGLCRRLEARAQGPS
ncbi:MAG: hypothetical protein VKK62_10095 [Synechococcaceae cyanobacterium]|nr:hypothetical protein [Synechococcaceae cyanobacterium]